MTFDQMNQSLPNGFHDAELVYMSVDFESRTLHLGMILHCGTIANPEIYRRAHFKVQSLCLFYLEPPDPTYNFLTPGWPVHIDGDHVRPGDDPKVDELVNTLPEDSTVYRFFMATWNSFFYLGGSSVEMEWADESSADHQVDSDT